ncbi:M12 family metallopeptidase [Pseudoxanthomonas japonensis]|uniref:Peptidase M12 n=1 Tax=Pseudoxanthomonas japonensis TaxID=69284 RepID=A0ABQ6ZMG9_9GAMM|nr:M12 family metallopeptidase [Pseudoxanthomonas japonensis]KAF1727531.1 peptidase M12 [Pseudoxanthomonas japonensis]
MTGPSSPFETPQGRRVTVTVDVASVGRRSGLHLLECVETHGRYYFEGDIVVAPMRIADAAIKHRSVVFGNRIRSRSSLWRGGVVPYASHVTLTDLVAEATAQWEQSTPVRFKRYDAEKAYVLFMPGPMNTSEVGCTGRAQTVTLREDATVETVMHEIGHALGLWHEHGRSDRDKHVQIHRQNILGGQGFQFDQVIKDGQDFGAYDVESIMHYDSLAFSVNSQHTITMKNGDPIPRNGQLSSGDIATVTAMYS